MNFRLDHITKSYAGDQTSLMILDDLALELNSGEIVAVIGDSGSGKSTLLSLMAGFQTPDRGVIHWGDRVTTGWSESTWAQTRRRDLGFVFQAFHLIPYLTALENVALPLRLLGRPDARARAAAALEPLGLGERGHHLPAQLSGGENQRVAIARAMVHAPGLVLADEPTGSLDQRTGETTLDLLFGRLRANTQTALIVTHADQVARRCDRTLRLKDGRLWSV